MERTWIVGMVALAGVVIAATAFFLLRTTGTDHDLRRVIAEQDLLPIEAVDHPDALVGLGRALFFDPILSGNRDISCATCHHPSQATGDGLAVSIGTGGAGIGPNRVLGHDRELVPRNATEIFNRGASEWATMFWDGRVRLSRRGELLTPAFIGLGVDLLPPALDSVLAAQAMFPVTSETEMRGSPDQDPASNEVAGFDDREDFPAIWDALTARLMAIDGYVAGFAEAFPEVPADDIGFEHAALAIAAFEAEAYTFTESPWDRYLRGDDMAMTEDAKQGALVFFGVGGCGECHTGRLLTDQRFHVRAVPQIGPGKEPHQPRDFGRAGAGGGAETQYAFRTPPLRNVTLTGPWTHAGVYDDLEDVVRHSLDPTAALISYDPAGLSPEVAAVTLETFDGVRGAILTYLERRPIDPITLTDAQVDLIMAFLESLTDPAAADLMHTIPDSVPSGLPIDR
ncbi:MAG: cytochrome-c peroxidase [Actinobacteria bacterium]|nr:cytochrome-c peroxidase [Actinomycetota bacterium]